MVKTARSCIAGMLGLQGGSCLLGTSIPKHTKVLIRTEPYEEETVSCATQNIAENVYFSYTHTHWFYRHCDCKTQHMSHQQARNPTEHLKSVHRVKFDT